MDYAYKAVSPSLIGDRFIITKFNDLPPELRRNRDTGEVVPAAPNNPNQYAVVDVLTNRAAIVRTMQSGLVHTGWYILESLAGAAIGMTLDEAIRIRQEIIDRKYKLPPTQFSNVVDPVVRTEPQQFTGKEIKKRKGMYTNLDFEPSRWRYISNGRGGVVAYSPATGAFHFSPWRQNSNDHRFVVANEKIPDEYYTRTGEPRPGERVTATQIRQEMEQLFTPKPAEPKLLTFEQIGKLFGVFQGRNNPLPFAYASDGKGNVKAFAFSPTDQRVLNTLAWQTPEMRKVPEFYALSMPYPGHVLKAFEAEHLLTEMTGTLAVS